MYVRLCVCERLEPREMYTVHTAAGGVRGLETHMLSICCERGCLNPAAAWPNGHVCPLTILRQSSCGCCQQVRGCGHAACLVVQLLYIPAVRLDSIVYAFERARYAARKDHASIFARKGGRRTYTQGNRSRHKMHDIIANLAIDSGPRRPIISVAC